MATVDHAFLAEQYRLHAEHVFKRCLIVSGGDHALAEDVTHDTFIRLLEKAATLDRSVSLRGWLLTVGYRFALQRLRRDRTRWARVLAMLSREPAPTSATQPEGAETLGRRMARSLSTLPPKERTVMVMRYMDGMPQTEIAGALGLSEGYVSKLLSRATARLRELDWEDDHV